MQEGDAPIGTKGQRAYTLRQESGRSWEEVASEVGSASSEAAVAGAKKYAVRHGLPWPVHTILHEAQAKAREDEQRAQARRDARVYQRVATGTLPNAISGMSATNVYRAIDRHVEATGDPPLARSAERAYQLRAEGELTWVQVAERLGYVRETAAIEAARVFAGTRDLPWPIQVDPSRLDADQYVGKKFYEAVLGGASWPDVARGAGKAPSYVRARAKVYANAHKLPWPLPS